MRSYAESTIVFEGAIDEIQTMGRRIMAMSADTSFSYVRTGDSAVITVQASGEGPSVGELSYDVFGIAMENGKQLDGVIELRKLEELGIVESR